MLAQAIQLDMFSGELLEIGSSWLSLTANEKVYIHKFVGSDLVIYQNKTSTYGGITNRTDFTKTFTKIKD